MEEQYAEVSTSEPIDLEESIYHGGQIIKNILIVGFVGGIIFGIIMLVRYFNSPAGKAVQQLFGAVATLMEGLASALNYMTGLFNQCTQGKDNNGNSVSGGNQAVSCLSMIGILAGIFIGAPLVLAGVKKLWDNLRPGSEQMKTMEAQVKDNLNRTLDENGETYNNLVESVKTNLRKSGKYDEDTDEGKAQLDNDAKDLVGRLVNEKAAKVVSDNAKNISKKSENSSDERTASEAQEKYQSASEARAQSIRDISSRTGMSEDDVKSSTDDIDDNVEEEMNRDIEEEA